MEKRNLNGDNIGIIFRRCPVEFSNRFDNVLTKYSNLIIPINPKWEKKADSWNTIFPTKADLILQINTIGHSELVINLGSSMVFDFAAFDKPCGFINYDVPNADFPNWSVKKIYNYIHFRSMPTKDSVFWINNPDEIETVVGKMMSEESSNVVDNAKKWFEKINQHPPQIASERIWDAITKICKK